MATKYVHVAAFDAPPSIKAKADFVCDGIDDDVEIAAAAKLGSIRFSAGSFCPPAGIIEQTKQAREDAEKRVKKDTQPKPRRWNQQDPECF